MDRMLENYTREGDLIEIRTYPDPVLTSIAAEVTEFNEELKSLCRNMLFTMYDAPGIGLAAPQIGISQRIFVLDVDYKREETSEDSGEYNLSEFSPKIFINPKIVAKEGQVDFQEGCLSLPEIFEDVRRAESVTVEYMDTDGNQHVLEAEELLSICIQHENDHLDGVVFIERLSMLKRNFIRKKLLKAKNRA